jgi:hypothetical protein
MITTVTQPFREAILHSTANPVLTDQMTRAFFSSVGLIVTIALIFLLINKDLLASFRHPVAVRLYRTLDVAVVPLAFAFLILAGITIHGVFND